MNSDSPDFPEAGAPRASKAPIILLVLALLGSGGLGYALWKQGQDHASAIESLKKAHTAELRARAEETQQALAAQNDQHQKAIASLNDDFDKRAADMRGQQTRQITAALKEFDAIFEGNREAMSYIDEMEARVKAGKEVSRQEVERLAVIVTALGYLKKEYQKPMQEFNELQAFFERRAQAAPEKPTNRLGLVGRLFSKARREEMREFYREEGERRAFEDAQAKFGQIYASAQRAMAAVDLNADQEIKRLQQFIEDKQKVDAQDMTHLFQTARQALRTHQEVLKFEPEAPATPPKVNP